MKPELSAKLESIRRRLVEMNADELPEQGDEAWGPDSETEGEAAQSAAGEGEAENVSDINDTFDAYVFSIVDSVLEEYEADEEAILDIVFDVAASLAEDGSLPEIPEESELQATAEWLGKAKSMGFGDLVMAVIEAEAEEADE